MTEPKHYGMHRHFTEACSVLMFGGGFKKGYVYGKTADERPCKIVENPVSVEDLHATHVSRDGDSGRPGVHGGRRPFHVTKDGKGKPVMDLFA